MIRPKFLIDSVSTMLKKCMILAVTMLGWLTCSQMSVAQLLYSKVELELKQGIDPRGCFLRDLDADGRADLILKTTGGVNWEKSPGDGRFEGNFSFVRLSDNADSISLLDFGNLDEDAQLEMVVAVGRELRLVDVVNDTNHLIHESRSAIVDLTHHDIDGDGDLDLLYSDENVITCLTNEGGLIFESSVAFQPNSGEALSNLGAGDCDGDGFPDIVVGFSHNFVLWVKNTGDGRFDPCARLIDSEIECPSDFVFWDFDEDKDQDLFIFNEGYLGFSGATVHINLDGKGLFERGRALARVRQHGFLVDFDFDGDLDLAGGFSGDPENDEEGGSNVIFVNAAPGQLRARTLQLLSGQRITHLLSVGDIDGDGRQEFLVSSDGQQLSILGSSAFDPRTGEDHFELTPETRADGSKFLTLTAPFPNAPTDFKDKAHFPVIEVSSDLKTWAPIDQAAGYGVLETEVIENNRDFLKATLQVKDFPIDSKKFYRLRIPKASN